MRLAGSCGLTVTVRPRLRVHGYGRRGAMSFRDCRDLRHGKHGDPPVQDAPLIMRMDDPGVVQSQILERHMHRPCHNGSIVEPLHSNPFVPGLVGRGHRQRPELSRRPRRARTPERTRPGRPPSPARGSRCRNRPDPAERPSVLRNRAGRPRGSIARSRESPAAEGSRSERS